MTAPSDEQEPDVWRGATEVDSYLAQEWDQGHGKTCAYWPDCQENGDHPNPFIYPSARPAGGDSDA